MQKGSGVPCDRRQPLRSDLPVSLSFLSFSTDPKTLGLAHSSQTICLARDTRIPTFKLFTSATFPRDDRPLSIWSCGLLSRCLLGCLSRRFASSLVPVCFRPCIPARVAPCRPALHHYSMSTSKVWGRPDEGQASDTVWACWVKQAFRALDGLEPP